MKKKHIYWALFVIGAYYFYVNMFPFRGEAALVGQASVAPDYLAD